MMLKLKKESLIIRREPIAQSKKYDLKILLAKIKENQLSEEIWKEDLPRGREVW